MDTPVSTTASRELSSVRSGWCVVFLMMPPRRDIDLLHRPGEIGMEACGECTIVHLLDPERIGARVVGLPEQDRLVLELVPLDILQQGCIGRRGPGGIQAEVLDLPHRPDL